MPLWLPLSFIYSQFFSFSLFLGFRDFNQYILAKNFYIHMINKQKGILTTIRVVLIFEFLLGILYVSVPPFHMLSTFCISWGLCHIYQGCFRCIDYLFYQSYFVERGSPLCSSFSFYYEL